VAPFSDVTWFLPPSLPPSSPARRPPPHPEASTIEAPHPHCPRRLKILTSTLRCCRLAQSAQLLAPPPPLWDSDSSGHSLMHHSGSGRAQSRTSAVARPDVHKGLRKKGVWRGRRGVGMRPAVSCPCVSLDEPNLHACVRKLSPLFLLTSMHLRGCLEEIF
jgi:hypothetical protein